MPELLKQETPGVVAILEAPDCFALEWRPPGNYAHAGKTQLFGGHREPTDPTPEAALRRELLEEVNFSPEQLMLLCHGIYHNSSDGAGNKVSREVTAFHALIGSVVELNLSATLRAKGTKVVTVGKTVPDIELARTSLNLTDFAHMALLKRVKGEPWA